MKTRPRFEPGRALGLIVATAALAAATAADTRAGAPLPPLTTAAGNPQLPGKFVWADLATDDARSAAAFYGKLFGWKFQDYGGYLIALNDARPVAGIFQRKKPAAPDAKSRWVGFISAPNVSKAQTAVLKNGGKVLAAPAKFPKRGEQAIFSDPEGAVFGLIKSSSGDPEDFVAEPGDWAWMQLLSRDARGLAEFYRKVAGYDIVENTEAVRSSDFVLTSNGYARATVRGIRNEKVKPTWLPFVRVASLSESLGKVSSLGGKVLVNPRPELAQGRVAVIADPTGAAVGLLELDPKLLKGGR